MKKIGLLVSICMFALVVGGCAKAQNDTPEPAGQDTELSTNVEGGKQQAENIGTYRDMQDTLGTDDTASNSSEENYPVNDNSVVIENLVIALYEDKQIITAKLNEAGLSYKEYDSYYMIDEALCVYFEDDICVRLSFLNEVPQTARGVHKDDSYSQLIEQYGDSFEKHTYADHGIYDVYRYSANEYICEFGILPEFSDAICNIEIYSPSQYPIYDYGEELE